MRSHGLNPTQGWAPAALGGELPFWAEERVEEWRVLPQQRQDEPLRHWCILALLRTPGTDAVVLAAQAPRGATLEGWAATPPPEHVSHRDSPQRG